MSRNIHDCILTNFIIQAEHSEIDVVIPKRFWKKEKYIGNLAEKVQIRAWTCKIRVTLVKANNFGAERKDGASGKRYEEKAEDILSEEEP